MCKYDVAIIGAGAVGCAVAKVLSEYKLNICVIEKEFDAGFETSGRNSGVVHAGFNNPEGSLKAAFCVEGSRGFEALARELGVQYVKTGKLVTGFSDGDRKHIEALKKRGEANGVKGLDIVDEAGIKSVNPRVQGNFALWSGETGVFNPFEYTIALAETAKANGVDFYFGCRVTGIEKNDTGNGENEIGRNFKIQCSKSGKTILSDTGVEMIIDDNSIDFDGDSVFNKVEINAETVINCAGLYSADVCRMMGIDRYEIRPCRGEYHILEKEISRVIDLPVYPVPDDTKGVLGVHLTPTCGGNIIIGPSAEFLDEKDDYGNDEHVMEILSREAGELLPELKNAEIIRSFAGIRPKLIDKKGEINGDFVIEEYEENKGFIYLVGIESPGITASHPIAKHVKSLAEKSMKRDFVQKEKVMNRRDAGFGAEARNSAEFDSVESEAGNGISKGFHYEKMNKMVCRCEKVTEGEILKAYDDIRGIGGIPTIKGIKNRTRAFMGSCQGCFCTIDTVELLRRERGVKSEMLTYAGPGSEMFDGKLK